MNYSVTFVSVERLIDHGFQNWMVSFDRETAPVDPVVRSKGNTIYTKRSHFCSLVNLFKASFFFPFDFYF